MKVVSEDITGKILLVDDDKSIRVTISEALESAGHTVVTAVDGEHGLEKFSEDTFDLVLLDMKMPGTDGMEVLKRIKTIEPTQPVIMITGFGTVETAVEAMKLGAVDYIQKPFTPEEIRAIVKRGLERKNLDEKNIASASQFIEYAKKAIVERDLDRAYEYLKNAVKIDPTVPEPFNLMGVIMEVRGNMSDAQRMYRAALALDPSYAPALKNLDRTVMFSRRRESVKVDELVKEQEKECTG